MIRIHAICTVGLAAVEVQAELPIEVVVQNCVCAVGFGVNRRGIHMPVVLHQHCAAAPAERAAVDFLENRGIFRRQRLGVHMVAAALPARGENQPRADVLNLEYSAVRDDVLATIEPVQSLGGNLAAAGARHGGFNLLERRATCHAVRRQTVFFLECLDGALGRRAERTVDICRVETQLLQVGLQRLDWRAGCALAERIVIGAGIAVRVLVGGVELFERFAARHAIRRQVILLLERLDRRNRRIAIIAVNGRVVEAELFQLRLQILDRAAGCALAERAVVLVAVRVFVRAVELFERFAARYAIRRQVILLLKRLDRRNRRIAVAAIDIGVVETKLLQLRLQILDRAAGCAFAERAVAASSSNVNAKFPLQSIC